MNPKVTFIVPCYNLAHLLPECIKSILQQTYRDFEILLLDDASPDNTPEVAKAFTDTRVRYIRNEVNLKHLRTYNKGIQQAKGEYIWLISADDYLRVDHVLERYVRLLESSPSIGYVFCPGYGVLDGKETRLLGVYAVQNDRDRILEGRALLKRLLASNFVLTPSGLIRRDCYTRYGLFDLNMPWAGDWYLWCLFAMHYDVGYFAEPMVCYRESHPASMTSQLMSSKMEGCAAEEIFIAWTLRAKAQEAGKLDIADECLSAIAQTYARTIASTRYATCSTHMDLLRFEHSLLEHTNNQVEQSFIRSRVYDGIGNELYWRGDRERAKRFYTEARNLRSWIKRALLSLGASGDLIRRRILGA